MKVKMRIETMARINMKMRKMRRSINMKVSVKKIISTRM